jgi:hypothetical protein
MALVCLFRVPSRECTGSSSCGSAVTNSAGANQDGPGLLLVEKLLHGAQLAADHERSQPDQGRLFDLAPDADPLYGPLMTGDSGRDAGCPTVLILLFST